MYLLRRVHPLPAPDKAVPVLRRGGWLLLAAALGVPISLLWDFSWESTVGIDLFWSPPHALTYAAMMLAGIGAASFIFANRGMVASQGGIRLGRMEAPLGAWLVLWSALAFLTAVLFDRWWQSAYGLGAGIWHPPQILKAIAFFSVVVGLWLFALAVQNERAENTIAGTVLCSVAGGLALALIHIVTLTSSYPNQQHSASFYKLACATYPIVLAALALSGRAQWPATIGSIAYAVVFGGMVWLLPLFPARPLVGPVYNSLNHLMPPPFPLLLVVPALVMDCLMKRVRWSARRSVSWWQTAALGFAFFFCFLSTQWVFADFLLKPSADNWFFVGGGQHWPFFLKISLPARVMFWDAPPDQMDGRNTLVALVFSIVAARVGLWVGAWMARVRR